MYQTKQSAIVSCKGYHKLLSKQVWWHFPMLWRGLLLVHDLKSPEFFSCTHNNWSCWAVLFFKTQFWLIHYQLTYTPDLNSNICVSVLLFAGYDSNNKLVLRLLDCVTEILRSASSPRRLPVRFHILMDSQSNKQTSSLSEFLPQNQWTVVMIAVGQYDNLNKHIF